MPKKMHVLTQVLAVLFIQAAKGQEMDMLCRPSDYRTIASDPNYDVVSVLADVDELGYEMLLTMKAEPKFFTSLTHVIAIYLLEGWLCKVHSEYMIYDELDVV